MSDTLHIPTPDELLAERPDWQARKLVEKCLEDLRRYYKAGGTVLVPIGDASDDAVFQTIALFEGKGWIVEPRSVTARFATGPHLAFVKGL